MAVTKFTNEHEWIRVEDGTAVVGITDYAQQQLGDVVFVELPAAGKQVSKGGEVAVIESVKAASEIYAPISGEVVEANQALDEDPAKVNADATGDGWIFRMTVSNPDELDDLMDEAAYQTFLKDLD